jgi:uncharacterized protein YndB with AHSA1/START domain
MFRNLMRAATLLGAIVTAALLLWMLVTTLRGGARYTASTEIRASPDTVWAWLQDPARQAQWVGWLREVRIENMAGGVGARRLWVMEDRNNGNRLMEVEVTFTEYDPPRLLAVSTAESKGLFSGTQTYRLIDLDNGATRLEMEGRYKFPGMLARMLSPLIVGEVRKKNVADLARLKNLAEGAPAGGFLLR